MAAEQLSRAVNLRLPDLNLGAKELSQNPKFAKLLLLLTDRVDRTGLHLSVKRQLEKAGTELRRQKRDWFCSEAMERVLQEMLTEQHINRWENPASPEDQQFFETLEECWVLATCCRRLDTRETVHARSCPPLLGLGREHVLELLPEAREVQAMKQRLVAEVEKRLREKCFAVLCYYRPEYDDTGEAVKLAKCGEMPEMLQNDRQRQDSERDQNRENQITITRETIAYLTVLYRTFEMLQELIERHRLGSQPQLDTALREYLHLKSKAMFAKLGLMKLDLRHQMFDQDRVESHQQIREVLLTELDTQQHSVKVLRGNLDLYRILGEEFEEMVAKYGCLREELDNKKWALQEFSTSGAEDKET